MEEIEYPEAGAPPDQWPPQALEALHKMHEGLQIKRLIEVENQARSTGKIPEAKELEHRRKIDAILEKNRPFVFHLKHAEPEEIPEDDGPGILDLPFPVCSFESYREPLYRWDIKGTGESRIMSCLVVYEKRPREYGFIGLATICRPEQGAMQVSLDPYADGPMMRNVVQVFLKKLQRSELATSRATERTRLCGKVHKIKDVIHVVPKKYVGNVRQSIPYLDWSHRWEVRGHWRTLSAEGSNEPDMTRIGKDRYGEYNTNGYTWISEHERGPEGKPLVRKVREVH